MTRQKNTPSIETLDDKADVNTEGQARARVGADINNRDPEADVEAKVHEHDKANEVCFCGKRSDGSEDVAGEVGFEYREGEGLNTTKHVVFRPKWRTSIIAHVLKRDVGGPGCFSEGCIEAGNHGARLKGEPFRDITVCDHHVKDEDIEVSWTNPDQRPVPPFSVKVGDIVATKTEKDLSGVAEHIAFGLVVAVDVPVITDLRAARQGVQLKELFVVKTTREDADLKPAFAGDLPHAVEAMLKSLI